MPIDAAWEEAEHPRGHEGNKGQFVKKAEQVEGEPEEAGEEHFANEAHGKLFDEFIALVNQGDEKYKKKSDYLKWLILNKPDLSKAELQQIAKGMGLKNPQGSVWVAQQMLKKEGKLQGPLSKGMQAKVKGNTKAEKVLKEQGVGQASDLIGEQLKKMLDNATPLGNITTNLEKLGYDGKEVEQALMDSGYFTEKQIETAVDIVYGGEDTGSVAAAVEQINNLHDQGNFLAGIVQKLKQDYDSLTVANALEESGFYTSKQIDAAIATFYGAGAEQTTAGESADEWLENALGDTKPYHSVAETMQAGLELYSVNELKDAFQKKFNTSLSAWNQISLDAAKDFALNKWPSMGPAQIAQLLFQKGFTKYFVTNALSQGGLDPDQIMSAVNTGEQAVAISKVGTTASLPIETGVSSAFKSGAFKEEDSFEPSSAYLKLMDSYLPPEVAAKHYFPSTKLASKKQIKAALDLDASIFEALQYGADQWGDTLEAMSGALDKVKPLYEDTHTSLFKEVNKYLDAVKTNFAKILGGGAVLSKQAVNPPKLKKGEDISTEEFKEHFKGLSGSLTSPLLADQFAELSSKWENTKPTNMAKIQPVFNQVKEAFAKASATVNQSGLKVAALKQVKQDLAKIEPIPSSAFGSAAVGAFNNWLGAVKTKLGVPVHDVPIPGVPAGPASVPGEHITPLQNAVYEVVVDTPPINEEIVSKAPDASGKEVKARAIRDTKDIPDHFYAKVTAALEGKANFDTEKVHKAMHAYAAYMKTSYDSEEQHALHSYISGSVGINHALAKDPDVLPNQAKLLRKAMARTFMPADMHLLRNVRNLNFKELTGFDDPAKAVGRVFVHKPFGSSTRSQQFAEGWGGRIILSFKLPAGTPVLFGDASHHSHEREVIISNNSVFLIDKIEQKVMADGKPQHVIHCTYRGVRA